MEPKMLTECIDYFRQNPGYHRALNAIREKYLSLGKLGGRIVLKDLTEEEKDALSAFLHRNCYQDQVTISVSRFPEALAATKYEEVDFLAVLEGFFRQALVSRKEKQQTAAAEKKTFFLSLLEEVGGTPAFSWLRDSLDQKGQVYSILSRKYQRAPEELRKNLLAVCEALNHLPLWEEKKMRLALFSSLITQNPHAFDENTDMGRLLSYGISFILGRKYPENAEEKLETLYHAGIIKDEISNYTLCSGLTAYRKDIPHPGWQGFGQQGEPIQVSLLNLSRIDRLTSNGGQIFVFENPTVFTEIWEKTAAMKPSLMCTYGQVKVASYVLLDLLAQEGTRIFYSGDFDPEGLLIADRLKNRYGDRLAFWRYGREDFFTALSGKKVSSLRMSKLDRIKNQELEEIAALIRETGLAAYQELLTEKLASDVACSQGLKEGRD